MTGCHEWSGWGKHLATAGRRIDPTSESTFVWRVPSSTGNEVVYPMTYTNWEAGQPDNVYRSQGCMAVCTGRSYKWDDYPCGSATCSVCELNI